MLPAFFVAGAPKCGTTALHEALAMVPGIFMSPVKEPKFFLVDDEVPRSGGPGDADVFADYVWPRSRYERLFDAARPGDLCGESTPFYYADPAALRRIRTAIPAAKFVVVIRDPVDRAYSNWRHNRVSGREWHADFIAACRAENDRLQRGWDPFWGYLRLSRYGDHLAEMFRLVNRSRIYVLRFEALAEQPAAAIAGVCRFLGVASIDASVARTNEQPPFAPPPSWFIRSGPEVQRLVRRAVPGRIRAWRRVRRTSGRITTAVSAADRKTLLPLFRDDIVRTAELLGEDLTDWLEPESS